jgi:hypothetical protein
LSKALLEKGRSGLTQQDFVKIKFTENKLGVPMAGYWLFFMLTGVTLPLLDPPTEKIPQLL